MSCILLEGPRGAGKSTTIKEAVSPYLDKTGGFFAKRIFVASKLRGFSLCCLKGSEDYVLNGDVRDLGQADNLFYYSDDQGNWLKDLQVFERLGNACLARKSITDKKLIVLDEIGGIEINCPSFMKNLEDLLNGQTAVLGVLKAAKNVKQMRNFDDETASKNLTSFRRFLEAHPRITITKFNESNRSRVKAKVCEFVQSAMGAD